MLSRFFIDRPIFATVLSVIITLTGGIALFSLPVAQYPRITPPAVVVSITYPGASSQVVADTVAAPIEQQVNGVEGMLYMSSQMGNDGTYTLTVTFDLWVDLKTALVKVQNRVALAMPQLPTEVQNQGITIRKKTPDILMLVNFVSPNGRYDDIYLSNFATIFVKDELLRVDGVSDITYMGERDYSIRTWLDPQKLAAYNLTAIDVANAIRAQNIDAVAGRIGQPPILEGQTFQLPVTALGRLKDTEQFGNIIVKVGRTGLAPLANAIMQPPRSNLAGPSTSPAPPTSSPIVNTADSTPPASGTDTGTPTPGVNPGTGGGMSPGGGNTGGGGTTGGGGSTAGGAMGGAAPAGTSGRTSANTQELAALGILSGQTMGRGTALPSAAIIRLRDVARIESGAQQYSQSCTFDGMPSVALGVYQLPTANGLDVADRVRAKMAELKTRFPDGIDYRIAYDITPFIRESVWDVLKTLLEAVVLVGMVVLVFLQDWRTMILPMIDVPVSLIGTFAVMAALGFSLNNISLFGLVLAIGIVVDDAIVVLENIERLIATGLDPRTATIKAMDEVTGPIIAVGLVLCAVFTPCALIGGITGQFFRQFAITIAVSTVISAINAVTMTPSRAVLIFKGGGGDGKHHKHQPQALPWWIFAWVGGLFTLALGQRYLAGRWGLPEAGFPFGATEGESQGSTTQAVAYGTLYVLPGFLLGGVLGWFIIRPVNAVLGWLFRGFNRGFDGLASGYGWTVGKTMRGSSAVLAVYVALLGLTWWVFQKAPTGFIPQQDQGRLIVNIQLPDSASLQRTEQVVQQVQEIAKNTKGVAHVIGIAGLSFLLQANSTNFASMFIVLDPFAKRQDPKLRDTAIMARLRREWNDKVPEAKVAVYGAAPVPGIGVAGGFKIILEDRGGVGLDELQKQTDALINRLQVAGYQLTDKALAGLRAADVPAQVIAKVAGLKAQMLDRDAFVAELAKVLDKSEQERFQALVLQHARQSTGLNSVATQFRSNTPQLFMDIDRTKAAALGVSLDDVNQTLDIFLGSLYVNSLTDFGRYWQVNIQAEGSYRNRIEAVNLFQIRNNQGQMVPLGTLVQMREVGGPVTVTRYNLYTAAAINGNVPPGLSTGDAINTIEHMANQSLPITMEAEWTELMFLQQRAGNKGLYIFLLAIVAVFLALSALYESWTLPLAVILVVPLCLLCSVAGVLWTNRDVNIFVQIGLVVLVGLACKNAILIVEYARQLHQEGRSIFEATQEASRLRLRPILMTSFAFILGVVPLVVASGAGAEMRRSLGTAVFSGMLGVTMFGIFLTPVFFYVIQKWSHSPVFEPERTRWMISSVMGGVVGLATGFLLARLGVVQLVLGVLVGPCLGTLAVLAVLGIHQSMKKD